MATSQQIFKTRNQMPWDFSDKLFIVERCQQGSIAWQHHTANAMHSNELVPEVLRPRLTTFIDTAMTWAQHSVKPRRMLGSPHCKAPIKYQTSRVAPKAARSFFPSLDLVPATAQQSDNHSSPHKPGWTSGRSCVDLSPFLMPAQHHVQTCPLFWAVFEMVCGPVPFSDTSSTWMCRPVPFFLSQIQTHVWTCPLVRNQCKIACGALPCLCWHQIHVQSLIQHWWWFGGVNIPQRLLERIMRSLRMKRQFLYS